MDQGEIGMQVGLGPDHKIGSSYVLIASRYVQIGSNYV